ncbi:MAG: hypothetical protein KYX68_06225 [Flavobacterium sp.]|nr:hypothetical protein [Flavobacterium sp.]
MKIYYMYRRNLKKKIKKKSDFKNSIDFLKRNETVVFVVSCLLVLFISIVWLSKKQDEEIKLNKVNYPQYINNESSESFESEYRNDLNDDLEMTKILLNELLNFKNKEDFHYYGFGSAYKYNDWLIKVGELKQSSNSRKILLEYGFSLGDLEMLGLEYVKTKGKETEYSLWAKQRIINGISQK